MADAEFARYVADTFRPPEFPLALPLADELFVSAWEEYVREASAHGAWSVLREKLPQLWFPIAAGQSETEDYRAATRKGSPARPEMPLELERPDAFSFSLHPTAAGRIPVLVARHRPDFVRLVQALAHRAEPVAIPDSQGASMVAGLNNWDRIARLRADFSRQYPGVGPEAWRQEFAANIKPRHELYQDRFIILSDGPYSGVPAAALGLDETRWREASLIIRREHECAHYFTRRVLGAMRNHVLDEVIADYMGIVAAAGKFRADWFRHFLGLEDFPRYRPGARLENYRGTLGDHAFLALQAAVHRAAGVLEECGFPAHDGTAVLLALSSSRLDTLTADHLRRQVGELAGRLARVA